MVGLHGLTQTFFQNMGIDLSRGNVRVPKHLLYGAKVGAIGKKVGRKGVSQNMWRYAYGIDAGCQRKVSQQLRKPLSRQVSGATSRGKQPWRMSTVSNKPVAATQECFDRTKGRRADRHEPLTPPLAVNQDEPALSIDRRKRQSNEFADAQSRRIEELKQRHGTQTFRPLQVPRRGKQRLDLRRTENFRERAPAPWSIEKPARIVIEVALSNEKPKKLPERRSLAGDTGRRHPAIAEFGNVASQARQACTRSIGTLAHQKVQKIAKIAAVCVDRLRRRTTFGTNHLQKAFEPVSVGRGGHLLKTPADQRLDREPTRFVGKADCGQRTDCRYQRFGVGFGRILVS